MTSYEPPTLSDFIYPTFTPLASIAIPLPYDDAVFPPLLRTIIWSVIVDEVTVLCVPKIFTTLFGLPMVMLLPFNTTFPVLSIVILLFVVLPTAAFTTTVPLGPFDCNTRGVFSCPVTDETFKICPAPVIAIEFGARLVPE